MTDPPAAGPFPFVMEMNKPLNAEHMYVVLWRDECGRNNCYIMPPLEALDQFWMGNLEILDFKKEIYILVSI